MHGPRERTDLRQKDRETTTSWYQNERRLGGATGKPGGCKLGGSRGQSLFSLKQRSQTHLLRSAGGVEVMLRSELGSTVPGKVRMQTGSRTRSPERAGRCEGFTYASH